MNRQHLHQRYSEMPYYYTDWGFSDLASHPKTLEAPDQWEVVDGDPPEGAVMYVEKTLPQLLSEALDAEITQIQEHYPQLLTDSVITQLVTLDAQLAQFFSRATLSQNPLILQGLIAQFDDGGEPILQEAKQRVLAVAMAFA